MSTEGQGHFFTIYFPGLYVLCLTRPRYQVSVYRTIGPLVNYAPNFEKVGGHIGFGLSVCMYVRMYVCMYVFMFEISS